jgi:hypothetical protein
MPHTLLNRQLLERLKRLAKKKSRDDPSLGHNKCLDELSAPYGYATFASLTRRVAEIEQQAIDESLAAEEGQWFERWEKPMVWGSLPDGRGIDETVPVPFREGSPCWPNCFSGSNLFTGADGPRRQLDGPVRLFFDGPEMHFRGEELRCTDDYPVFAELLCAVGHYPCGRLVEFSAEQIETAVGQAVPEWRRPVRQNTIARTLWRLVHCELTVRDFKFKGPLLSYADARRGPENFAIRLNPDFANLYYPFLTLFGFTPAEK